MQTVGEAPRFCDEIDSLFYTLLYLLNIDLPQFELSSEKRPNKSLND